ncbi:MAG: ABC transporter permease [Clostridiales bacterium]|jgi:simple sugar transport system permease protein|nr:ABC transporter permease [Clostridiales bacterium]
MLIKQKNKLLLSAREFIFSLILVFSISFLFIIRENIFYFIQEIIDRFTRNIILVLSLLLPSISGIGINFGIAIGIMIAQLIILYITSLEMCGIWGIVISFLLAVPISILTGYITGLILDRCKNREIIASMIIGFFVFGFYQLFLMYLCGDKKKFKYVISFKNKNMLLPRGYGLRNTIDLKIASVLDNFLALRFFINKRTVKIPVLTLLVIFLFCLAIKIFQKTKLGQEIRATGYDKIASINAGINIKSTRIISIIISTLLACCGQIIYLQNIGVINTYNTTEQSIMFTAASFLLSKTKRKEIRIRSIILATLFFHTVFVITPMITKIFINNPIYDEYIRNFISYLIIFVSLFLAAQKKYNL